MGSRDPRIDAYVAKAGAFARPLLIELRARVHAGCPDVIETLKWGHPSFEYRGILAGMAAFKAHCAFGFWKHELLAKDDAKAREAMGSFGRLRTLADLPGKAAFARCLKQAMVLNEKGIASPRKKTRPKRPLRLHPDFKAALARDAEATATFGSFPPGQRSEYVEWIHDAKQDVTRARRIAQAIEWLAAGKRRNWKYERC